MRAIIFRVMTLLCFSAALLSGATAHAQDLIGLYWDDALTQIHTSTTMPYEIVTGHLVIMDPTSSGGILAWECHIDIEGPALLTATQVYGQAINAESPPRYAVGLVDPLPPAAVTEVATIQIMPTEIAPVTVSLKPLYFASIPGEMSYLGGDNPNDLTVMSPATGEPIVATINKDVFIPELNRTSINFPELALGQSQIQYLRVTNVGGGILPLSLSLDCTDPGFTLPGGAISIGVPAGQYVNIAVKFTAQVTGLASCTLQLGEYVQDLSLTGWGREPITSWTTPDDVVFGNRAIYSFVSLTTTLINDGETPLTLDVGWVGSCTDFEIIGGEGPVTLAAGYRRHVDVLFTPQSTASLACSLSFGPGFPTVSVTGTGYYTNPVFSLNTEFISFPSIPVDGSRTQLVRITNTGTLLFPIDPQLVDADPAFSLGPNAHPISLSAGTSWDFYVHFNPLIEGQFTGSLAMGDRLPSIHLDGTAGLEVILCDVSADTLEFNVSSVGQTVSRTISINNISGGSFQLMPSIVSAAYAITPASATLGPGQTALFQIDFTPSASGIHTDTLVLGPGLCTTVALHGVVGPGLGANENLIGFFFDPDLNTNISGAGSMTIPVYLALKNATDTSGIQAWECRVAITGNASFTTWELAGNAVNATNNENEFAVGIGLEPLPYAPDGTLLATFELLIHTFSGGDIGLQLYPKWTPSLDGLMAWIPWSDVGQLLPMQTITGTPTVASLYAVSSVGDDPQTPVIARTELLTNVPNPFNPQTRIRFQMAQAGRARVTIYDVTGRLVKTLVDGQRGVGQHSETWQGRDNSSRQVSSGAYYIRLETNGLVDHQKVLMLK